MATGNFVVVRRTISQTLVPYKEVEEKLLRRLGTKSRSQRLSSTSTNTVVQCGVTQWKDPKRVTFDEKPNILERSRSEVCLRRKGSYARETSLDAYEERPRQEELVKPILRQRERDVSNSPRRSNMRPLARPKSDFFPEFKVKLKKNEVGTTESEIDPEKRLGRSIATLQREMISLRKQDRELLKQLTSLNEHIKDLKELSRIQGGLFGSCEDDEDIGECLSISGSSNVERTNSTPITGTNSPRKGINRNGEKPTEKSNNKKNDGNKMKGGVRKLQETAFEYNGEPLGNTAAQQRARMVKNVKPLRPMSLVVPKKKSLRLERKSVSCQFLDSGSTREKKDLSAENLKTVDARQCSRISSETLGGSRTSSYIVGRIRMPEKHVADPRNLDIKQKSLSMSQLKGVTKTTEVSTSDSECSTSGCYGGSSTGSELELERSVADGHTSTDEEHEKFKKLEKGKAFDLELLKAVTKPQKYHAISSKQPGQFRKKIVSV